MTALLDVNLLLALAWSNHPHHEAAHRWFENASGEGWATCLFTQTGFLRLSMNPQIVGVAIKCEAAVALLKGLVAHPSHQYIETGLPLTAPQFDELSTRIAGYRQVTDATLLYLARAHSLKLATFDSATAAICPWPENLAVLLT